MNLVYLYSLIFFFFENVKKLTAYCAAIITARFFSSSILAIMTKFRISAEPTRVISNINFCETLSILFEVKLRNLLEACK